MTEKEKMIQELSRENERLKKEIALLQQIHYEDQAEIVYQRRQIDFLMDMEREKADG